MTGVLLALARPGFSPAAPAAVPAAAPAASAPVIVRVGEGRLAGFRQGPADAFLGIPYAAPPVGRNRWRAPRPAARWQGIRPARTFAASCWQHMTPAGVGPWTHEFMPQGRASDRSSVTLTGQ